MTKEHKLNKNQEEAIKYIDSPLLIVAGAGTGKTTVITQKIAHIIKNNLAKPEEILALTFTDKAAQEMQERLDNLLEISYSEMQISTFHSFCRKVLENYGLDIGLSNRFKLLTETEIWLLIRENLHKFNLDYYQPLGNPTRHIHELIKHFSKCKDELITPQEYLDYAENVKLNADEVNKEEKNRLTEIANAYHVYNQILLDNNVLDFGDLIFYTVKLLQKRKKILQFLQKQFKFILVDEFQDVNYAQYELVKLLSNNQCNQLTVVGDDDQSIYAFRGASVSNILRFKEDFAETKEIVLVENYRSGQEILDLAYQSIQNNNPDRLEIANNINKKLISDKNGQPPELIFCDSLSCEADMVVEKIKELKNNGKNNYNDFAILVRANNHADPFIQSLNIAGIPYVFSGASGLFQQSEIKFLVAFLKTLSYPDDNLAIYQLAIKPHFWEKTIHGLHLNPAEVRPSRPAFLAKVGSFFVVISERVFAFFNVN